MTAPRDFDHRNVHSAADGLDDLRAQKPEWTPSPFDPDVELASLLVPLDYADLRGERISIAISRRRATGPGDRRGILMAVNGGPGGNEGLGIVMQVRFRDTPLNEVYDLIGFDPRGSGESTPVFAENTPLKVGYDSRVPDERFPAVAEDMRAIEEGCRRAGGAVREHITTRNTARDMDVIRAVLGEERINFIGHAYGTYVGAVYGTMFPERLDRSVLDSSVHPDWLWRTQFLMQASAIRGNVDQWAGWTAERDNVFRLGRSADEVLATVESVAVKLMVQPVHGVTRTVFDGAVGNSATLRTNWDGLCRMVHGLGEGDPEAARVATSFAQQGLRSGTYPSYTEETRAARESVVHRGEPPEGHRKGVLEAVTCEVAWPTDAEIYHTSMRVHRERYPYGLGMVRAQPWVSTFSAITPREEPTRVERSGYPVGVIVHAEGDPLNPYDGGLAMAERLGHHLVTVADDGGHELYPEAGNQVVNEYVTAYLLDGVLPPSRVTCPGDPRPDVAADTAR